MSTASIRIDQALFDHAFMMAKVHHRSPPKQIEHWAQIGKMMEDNPDLPYAFVRAAMVAKAELEAGQLESYSFG